jgi:toxin ParE1/3/4
VVSVVWSDEASADVRQIAGFVSRDSKDAAEQLTTRLVQSMRRIEQFPRSGRMVPEHGRDDIREVIVDPYRVIYVIDPDVVRVVLVQHSAQRLRDIPGT